MKGAEQSVAAGKAVPRQIASLFDAWPALTIAALIHLNLLSPAFAAGPQDRVKETLSAVSAVLVDPQLQGSEKAAERKQRVGTIIHETFDFGEMGRESLGAHWAKLTPRQREEFVGLFGHLFEASYNRLVIRFLGESQATYGTESIDNSRALVHTTLIRKGGDELPVDYHLSYNGQRWAVSDVAVDGVSLATNFQSQFDRIMRTASYEVLVEKMKAKLEQERRKDS